VLALLLTHETKHPHGRLYLYTKDVFAQFIFTLTEQVQNVFDHNPGFDLRSMLTASDNLMHGILDESGPNGNAGPFLVSGVQSYFPISFHVRERSSRTLQSIGGETENTAFALLIVGDKLLTLVQPAFRHHQLRVSDLHLILNFLSRQPGLFSSELWIPFCLPRFNSSGFLYAYTRCLHVETKLSLVLISPLNTTEQFQTFRDAANKIQDELGFPAVVGSVLTIVNSTNSNDGNKERESDVEWTRSTVISEDPNQSDDDYVDVSSDGERIIDRPSNQESTLLQELKRNTTDTTTIENIVKECLDEDYVMHFLFRIDVPVRKGKGNLTQCISPPLAFPFIDGSSKRRVWSYYQKMSLRLRLGSATVESTMDAFDMISQDKSSDNDRTFPGIAKYCPAIGLLESAPNAHGVTYIVEGSELFLAMNGRDFEL
jgi:hypothetical protein